MTRIQDSIKTQLTSGDLIPLARPGDERPLCSDVMEAITPAIIGAATAAQGLMAVSAYRKYFSVNVFGGDQPQYSELVTNIPGLTSLSFLRQSIGAYNIQPPIQVLIPGYLSRHRITVTGIYETVFFWTAVISPALPPLGETDPCCVDFRFFNSTGDLFDPQLLTICVEIFNEEPIV